MKIDHTDTNEDHALTFKEWSVAGFWIIKGSKAVGFNPLGEALFTPSQVKERFSAPRPNYRSTRRCGHGYDHRYDERMVIRLDRE